MKMLFKNFLDFISRKQRKKSYLLQMLLSSVMAVLMIPRLAIIVLVSLLMACGGEVDLSSVGAQPLTITRYQTGGASEEVRVLPPSKVHEGLFAWGAKHKTGWKSSYVTYAPGRRISVSIFCRRRLFWILEKSSMCVRAQQRNSRFYGRIANMW